MVKSKILHLKSAQTLGWPLMYKKLTPECLRESDRLSEILAAANHKGVSTLRLSLARLILDKTTINTLRGKVAEFSPGVVLFTMFCL